MLAWAQGGELGISTHSSIFGRGIQIEEDK
jgi:hypothetical protein